MTSLYAEVTGTDGQVVTVRDVPVPPPASRGRMNVKVPYGSSLPEICAASVRLFNGEVPGLVLTAVFALPVVVAPGDTIEFTTSG